MKIEFIDELVKKMLDAAFYAGDDWRSDIGKFTIVGKGKFLKDLYKSMESKSTAVAHIAEKTESYKYVTINNISFQIEESDISIPILYISNYKIWDGEYTNPQTIPANVGGYDVKIIIDVIENSESIV